MTAAILLGSAIVSYLLGSIPTGFLWARARGTDIRKVGSGNIGATNVMRSLGRGPGIMVLLLDAAKGFLPVFFAPLIVNSVAEASASAAARAAAGVDRSTLQIVCCISVIAGHNWTCWLKFKGGKGVATSAGALLAFLPVPLLCGLGVWLVVFGISRYVSLASISAALAVPIATWLTEKNATLFAFTAILGALAIYKHKSNIQRLLAGTENRVGTKRNNPHRDPLLGRERGTAADVSSPRLRGEDQPRKLSGRGEGHGVA
jgi:glycerol-3-phosphate acyltransferase PlsY